MIENPEQYIEGYAAAGADHILVHQETCPHLHAVVQEIRRHKARPGVVLNPATPVAALESILEEIDILLIMSVNPGFGGQRFIQSSLEKVRAAAAMRADRGLEFLIEVDGGVKTGNVGRISQAGADVFVVGTGVFATDDYEKTIAELRRAVTTEGMGATN
jgi:ribulose-phosphate 3-epimerase